jgi:hypothetical protein
MKLLFLENRYATRVWSLAAERLRQAGHEVHWLVQNPLFQPEFGQVHVLPFPDNKQLGAQVSDEADRPLKYPDRSIVYAGRSNAHHGWYRRAIRRALEEIRPDVMFGECTQFYELLAIEAAQERGIPYLCAAATRYPAGRMMFHLYASMEPVGGSGERLDDDAAKSMLAAIRERRVVLSYMVPPKGSAWQRKARRWRDQALISWGWLRGERYATPSPWTKMRLNSRQRQVVQAWESVAVPRPDERVGNSPWVLYPLQMQPESNIEVWGYPWFDQVAIVRRAADALARVNAKLVVKPNPKSKYEMSRSLQELCASHPAIVPISHQTKMNVLLPHTTLVLSVTGTVILESAFGLRPVAVLGEHALTKVPGVTPVQAPEDCARVLSEVMQGRYKFATEAQLLSYLQTQYANSYPGCPFDPLNQPEMQTPENVAAIRYGFESVLGHLSGFQASRAASGRAQAAR